MGVPAMDNELVAALRAGIAAFRNWREQHKESALDLTGADLTGIDLGRKRIWQESSRSATPAAGRERGVVWDRALQLLEGAGITEHSPPTEVADLSGADFTGATLDRANLCGALLGGARFHEARLRGADLSHADLEGADFTSADLVGANLARARISRAAFIDTQVRGISLQGVEGFERSRWHETGRSLISYRKNLNGIDFEGADLRGVDFSRTSLRGANLKRCDISDADFTDAFLEQAQLDDATAASTRFVRADLGDARFRGAKLGKVDFEGAHADDADFSRADVIGCSFVGASLEGADFSRAVLNSPDFSDANIRWARFDAAIVSGPRAFRPNQTFSTGILHATPPRDPWSILRARYTGIRFALNLGLLALFLLPYGVRAVLWLGINAAETRLIDQRTGKLRLDLTSTSEWLKSLSALPAPALLGVEGQEAIQRDLDRHRGIVLRVTATGIPAVDRSALAAIEGIEALQSLSRQTAGLARTDIDDWRKAIAQASSHVGRLAEPWEPVPLWRLLIPHETGQLMLALTIIVVVYNLIRAVLTIGVGTLRDEELLTSCSPAEAQYLPYFRLHRIAAALFYFSLLAFALSTYSWMTTIVWMPPLQ